MQPSLTLSCGEYKRTRPLLDGRVQIEGFQLRILPDPFPSLGLLPDYQQLRNERMVKERAFDICELGMAPYLSARDAGAEGSPNNSDPRIPLSKIPPPVHILS